MAFDLNSLGTLAVAYFPTAAVDVVGVYTQSFSQVFEKARPLKVTITPPSKLMDHPIETGEEISDFRILLPIELELSMIVSKNDYRETYQEIIGLFESGEILIVQTYAATYENQVILQPAHEESSDIYNAIALSLKMRQVQFVTTSVTIAPKNVKDTPTQNRGTQIPQTTTPSNDSSLKSLFNPSA